MIIYKNCRIIDGTGAPAIENATLAVENSKIAYAGPASGLPEDMEKGATAIDLKGRTVLPGLFNCHVHLALRFPFTSYKIDEYKGPGYRAMVMYRRLVEAMCCGITTIRSTGESDDADLAVRNAVNNNMFMGARLITAGPIIIADGGHGAGGWGSIECSGPDEFTKATRRLLFKGVDFIKICITGGMAGEHEGAADMQMDEYEIAAVAKAAANAGKIVAAHLGHDTGIRAAVNAGVKSIEHAYIMNMETAEMVREKGAYIVPTLAVSNACDYLTEHNNPAYHVEKIRQIGESHRRSIENAVKAGVKLAVGTDLLPSDPLDGTNATVREVELLTEVGLSNLEALKAATANSAELCGVHHITGTIAAGMEADIIAVGGKPDENIKDLRNLDMVLKGGSLVWSKVEGDTRQGFSMLPFGEIPAGASFINW